MQFVTNVNKAANLLLQILRVATLTTFATSCLVSCIPVVYVFTLFCTASSLFVDTFKVE